MDCISSTHVLKVFIKVVTKLYVSIKGMNIETPQDQANMTPIFNENLSIQAIHLKLKKDPFPSKLCSHIPSKMDPNRAPGKLLLLLLIMHVLFTLILWKPNGLTYCNQIVPGNMDSIKPPGDCKWTSPINSFLVVLS